MISFFLFTHRPIGDLQHSDAAGEHVASDSENFATPAASLLHAQPSCPSLPDLKLGLCILKVNHSCDPMGSYIASSTNAESQTSLCISRENTRQGLHASETCRPAFTSVPRILRRPYLSDAAAGSPDVESWRANQLYHSVQGQKLKATSPAG